MPDGSIKPDNAGGLESRLWRSPVTVSGLLDPLVGAPSPEDFYLLAEHLPVLCWMARADGYINWYNRRWHDYCGSTPDQMEGWGWQSVHAPDELPRVMEAWTHSIAQAEPFEMTFPLRGIDGVFRPFLTRIVPVRDDSGEIKRWLGVNTEVTTQQATQAALKVSEQKYDVLTNAMPQMVWSTLPDGFHDYYNAQWYEFTGVPYGSTDGEGWNGMFHPEDQDRAWARWRHSLETESLTRSSTACAIAAASTAGRSAAPCPCGIRRARSSAGSAPAPISMRPSVRLNRMSCSTRSSATASRTFSRLLPG